MTCTCSAGSAHHSRHSGAHNGAVLHPPHRHSEDAITGTAHAVPYSQLSLALVSPMREDLLQVRSNSWSERKASGMSAGIRAVNRGASDRVCERLCGGTS